MPAMARTNTSAAQLGSRLCKQGVRNTMKRVVGCARTANAPQKISPQLLPTSPTCRGISLVRHRRKQPWEFELGDLLKLRQRGRLCLHGRAKPERSLVPVSDTAAPNKLRQPLHVPGVPSCRCPFESASAGKASCCMSSFKGGP